MIETPTPAAPAKGLFARIVGVITSPRATYEAVVAHPRPAGVMFIAALVIGLAQGLPQFTAQGQQAAIAMQLKDAESFRGQPLDQAAIDRTTSFAKYGPYIAIVSSLIILPLGALIFGGLYWVAFNVVMGGTATFKQVLAIVAHSQVIGALGFVIAAPIQLAQGVMTRSGPFNLGMLVPMLDESSVVAKVLTATSVFAIWQFFNTGTGLGVLFKKNGVTIAIVLLVLYFLIAGGLTALFSR